MLVLSRKVGEEIVIGDDIRITVVDMRGGKVRIGIVAPKDVLVDRKEIHNERLKTLSDRPGPKPIKAPIESLVLDWQPLLSEKPRLIASMKSSAKSAFDVKAVD